MTISVAAARLAVVNFQSPKFKTADNPIAAADDFSTKVRNSDTHIMYFNV